MRSISACRSTLRSSAPAARRCDQGISQRGRGLKQNGELSGKSSRIRPPRSAIDDLRRGTRRIGQWAAGGRLNQFGDHRILRLFDRALPDGLEVIEQEQLDPERIDRMSRMPLRGK